MSNTYGKNKVTQDYILETILELALLGGLSHEGYAHAEGLHLVVGNRSEIEDKWANVSWLWEWNDDNVATAIKLIKEWDQQEPEGKYYLDGMKYKDSYWEWWKEVTNG